MSDQLPAPFFTQASRNEAIPQPAATLPAAVLNNLSQSIFVKDRNLRYVLANQAYCHGLNTSLTDLLGRDDFAFFPSALAEKFQADDRRVLRDGTSLESEEHLVCEGKLRIVHLAKSPHYGPDGIEGVVGTLWDVTDQRLAENHLRKAQKKEAVGQLAGDIAQDMGNLLTGILDNLALARQELPAAAPARSILARAEDAGQRAADLTRQLLGFSRRMQPRPEFQDDGPGTTEALEEAASTPHPLSAKRCEVILLADDHETVRGIGREILENYGYRVLLATSGAQAVEILEEELIVDLAVVDCTLPKLQLTLQRLRELDPKLPILFSAAYPSIPATKTVETHQAGGFIAKPFHPRAMARAIRTALDKA